MGWRASGRRDAPRVEQYFLEEVISFCNFWDRVQRGDINAKCEEFEGPVAYKIQLAHWRELWPRYRVGVEVPEFKEAMDRIAAQPPRMPSA